jgi:hypothetical protein
MDIWAWLTQKIFTECGALGVSGWAIAIIVGVQLAIERRHSEKQDQQMRQDLIMWAERAEARAAAIADLSKTVSEIRGRLSGRGDDGC